MTEVKISEETMAWSVKNTREIIMHWKQIDYYHKPNEKELESN